MLKRGKILGTIAEHDKFFLPSVIYKQIVHKRFIVNCLRCLLRAKRRWWNRCMIRSHLIRRPFSFNVNLLAGQNFEIFYGSKNQQIMLLRFETSQNSRFLCQIQNFFTTNSIPSLIHKEIKAVFFAPPSQMETIDITINE